jgi:hypothetical protein
LYSTSQGIAALFTEKYQISDPDVFCLSDSGIHLTLKGYREGFSGYAGLMKRFWSTARGDICAPHFR